VIGCLTGETRDFVCVDDVVDALILAMKKASNCEIFNIGTGVAITINKLSRF